MIEQHVTDPYPDGTVFVETEGLVAKIYFADDEDGVSFIDNQLLAVKNDAKIAVKHQCRNKILDGFSSSASGEVINYGSSIEDQINIMSASVASVALAGLNPAQVLMLNKDMVARRAEILAENEARKSEIDFAIAESDIKLIVDREWS